MMETLGSYSPVRSLEELDQVLKTKERVFALIYATWCPFCITFLPVFQRHAQGKTEFILVQDNQETVMDQYGVDVVPTVLFFENGKISKRLDGTLGVGLNEGQLVSFIEKCKVKTAP